MKIVIQCASSKRQDAGSMVNASGSQIKFCAVPSLADTPNTSARPDDMDGSGQTWRDKLVAYNERFDQCGENPQRLVPAGLLYTKTAYADLRKFDPEFFILSAGWGLIRSSYPLPDYDVTFSKNSNVPPQNRRSSRQSGWKDFNHLASDVAADEEIHFFGSKEYLPLFYELAEPRRRAGMIVIHHKGSINRVAECRYEEFEGSARTNWHYLALSVFLERRRTFA